MTPPLTLRNPRDFLRHVAAAPPRPALAVAIVLATSAAAVAIDLLAAAITPGGGGAAAVVIAVALPAFYIGFWLVSGFAVDAGARAMGCEHHRATYLGTSATVFPVLLSYPLLTLAQALATHFGAAPLGSALGWLGLPLLAWFVWLGVLSAAAVYDVELFSAAALAMLPYAVTTAALLAFIVIISALHSAGVT